MKEDPIFVVIVCFALVVIGAMAIHQMLIGP